MRLCAPLALVLFLPVLAGCETSPKERLEGRWVGEQVDNFHPGQAARALGWAKGTALEFKGSRVTVSIPAESPRHGTFKIPEADDQQLRLTFLRPHGAADEATFVFEQDERLRWMLGDGRSIVLRKVTN